MNIKDILFNPTQFSLADLKELIVQQEFTTEELKTVLRQEAYDQLISPHPGDGDVLPCVGLYGPTESENKLNQREMIERNVVVLWGRRGAGKTTLINSLVNVGNSKLPVIKIRGKEKKQASPSDVKVRSFQSSKWNPYNGGWHKLRTSSDDRAVKLVHIDREPHYFGRRYSFTFAEVNLTNKEGQTTNWNNFHYGEERKELVELILRPNPGHIHIFCLDCSPEVEISQQVKDFEKAIQWLKSTKLIDEANALYIAVMKADLMNAPKPYLNNAAQTLVTSQLSSFWQTIRNHCYDKHIYNVQPLTCSVGDFVLKDFAHTNSQYTEHIFADAILPKCQPRKLFYERWLGLKLPAWLKWIVLPVVLTLMLLGMAIFYDNIIGRPVSQVTSFDYANYFSKEIITNLRGADYDQAHQSYQRLNADLHTERRLRTSSDDLVITDSVAEHCDQLLTTAFAPILKIGLEAFFKTDGWSSQQNKISKFNDDINTIKGKELSAEQRAYFNSSKEFFLELNRINDFLGNCNRCSDYDVLLQLEKKYSDSQSSWTAEPYSIDTQLQERIITAIYNANNHYATCCQSWLQTPLNNYYKRIKELNWQYNNGMEWTIYRQYVYKAKKNLKNDAQWAINQATILNDHFNSKGGDYIGLREILYQKISEINEATEDAYKWQSLSQNLTSKIKSLFN